jgi:hypothetical protein
MSTFTENSVNVGIHIEWMDERPVVNVRDRTHSFTFLLFSNQFLRLSKGKMSGNCLLIYYYLETGKSFRRKRQILMSTINVRIYRKEQISEESKQSFNEKMRKQWHSKSFLK